MEIFLTSDSHFMHNVGFLYEPRGFTNIEDMNEAIVERWNKVVKPDDIVYHLGDTMLKDTARGCELMKRLNGQIFLIWGNHDSDARKNAIFESCPNVIGGWYAYVIKHKKMNIYLSHYPTITSNYDEKHFSQHVLNLHGHTHQQKNFLYPNNPFCYHVGMDSHNCTPVHIDEVMADVRQRWQDLQTLKIPIQELYSYPQDA